MDREINKRLAKIEAMLESLLAGYPAVRSRNLSVSEQAAQLEAQGVDIAEYLTEKNRLDNIARRKKRHSARVRRDARPENS